MQNAHGLAPLWSALLEMMSRRSKVTTLEFQVGGLTDMGSATFDARDSRVDGPLATSILQSKGTLVFMMQDFLQDGERAKGWWYHVGDGQCIARHFIGLQYYNCCFHYCYYNYCYHRNHYYYQYYHYYH